MSFIDPTGTIAQRWASRELIGDNAPVQIVRIRPGYMQKAYGGIGGRIDANMPIFPYALIWQGQNHNPWQGTWIPTAPWLEVPNIIRTKWTRDFDPTTGKSRGTSTLTVEIDNIIFQAMTGVAGNYHEILRGFMSPERGYVAPGRSNLWPNDTPNEWFNALNGGWQIELWEGYGSGASVTLLPTMDPLTHSYAPPNATIDRTWTGIVVDMDTESHPDKITVTAQDFGIFLTDQRIMGRNKPPEVTTPLVFADRNQTQGQTTISGPLNSPTGSISADQWTSGPQAATTDTVYVELTIPAGYYHQFYVAPQFPGETMYVELWLNGPGTLDSTTPLPAGWVTLSGPGTGTDANGIPYFLAFTNVGTNGQTIDFGHGFDVPAGSKIRLTFTQLYNTGGGAFEAGVKAFQAFRYGTNPATSPGAGVNAKGWILVSDAYDVVQMILMWAGFKEWSLISLGWSLHFPLWYGESHFLIDPINDIVAQGNLIFYMGPPTNDDRSLGKPYFQYANITNPVPSGLVVRDTDMLEGLQVKWDLSDLPWSFRYRGAVTPSGFVLGQDLVTRYMATYYPPWSGASQYVLLNPTPTYRSPTQIRRVAGIHRFFTETMGLTQYATLTSNEECLFACVLAAMQYCLGMCTAQFQIPGITRLKLNDTIDIEDEASAVNSRLWVTSIESEHVSGGGESPGYWTMTVGGSIIDTDEMSALIQDYNYTYGLAQQQRAGGPAAWGSYG